MSFIDFIIFKARFPLPNSLVDETSQRLRSQNQSYSPYPQQQTQFNQQRQQQNPVAHILNITQRMASMKSSLFYSYL